MLTCLEITFCSILSLVFTVLHLNPEEKIKVYMHIYILLLGVRFYGISMVREQDITANFAVCYEKKYNVSK